MRICIDATGLGSVKTGTAVYVTEILKCWNADSSLDHEFVIFASPKTVPYLRNIGLDRRFHFIDAPDRRAIRVFWQQLALPRLLRRLRADVHWGSGFILPLLANVPTVVTVHDLSAKLFAGVHEPVKRWYFPKMTGAAVRKAKQVIAISASTERDLHTHFPVSHGKTAITLLAARELSDAGSSDAVPPGFAPARYLVCLGTVEPRKNIARLLEAWLGIDERHRQGIKLAVVGVRGWMMDDLLARYQGDTGSITFTGFIDDSALKRLMQGAIALAYPSLYEGFGLPVLEAMAQGVPVLTSDVGATKEISADAALLVNPMDVSDIRGGLLRLLSDTRLRQQLAERGRQQAAKFSWDQTARETLRVIEAAAA
ncbi:glycosyltransferase family 4 protein [Paraburkholderia sp. BR10954]|uniref:glycosyltransferase family 4 protein n=1 Tax=Paraburkholderia sp. BR10954 TaxID=3236995 RepID=UPI0034D2DA25